MVIKLKCKNCGKVQEVRINDINQDEYYRCIECESPLKMRDSSIISNLTTLEDFEIISIRKNDDSALYTHNVFETDIRELVKLFNKSDTAEQEMMKNIIDKIFLILHDENHERTKKLENIVRQHFFESIDEKNTKA